MSPKKYTVLVIPEGSHQVRRFNLKRGVLRAVSILSLVCLATLGVLAYDYFQLNVDYFELDRLRGENIAQKKELRQLAANLDDLQKEMVVLTQNDAKVRVMAKLSAPPTGMMSGVGGPAEVDSVDRVAALQRQIDQIRTDIDLRRESQEEIQGFLNDQRSLLASKPKGFPAKGWLTSGFGVRDSPFTGKSKMHEGLDFAARTGAPVFATADGIVSSVETDPGYGRLVVLDHGYGYRTYYGHNSKISVKVGQRVKRGDVIAAVGNTGRSTGTHLHYEVRLNEVPLNPKKFL